MEGAGKPELPGRMRLGATKVDAAACLLPVRLLAFSNRSRNRLHSLLRYYWLLRFSPFSTFINELCWIPNTTRPRCLPQLLALQDLLPFTPTYSITLRL